MDKNIYEFKKNPRERIVFTLSRFLGKRLIHVRTWKNTGDTEESWVRTRSGICIDIRLAEELKKGVEKILAHIASEDF